MPDVQVVVWWRSQVDQLQSVAAAKGKLEHECPEAAWPEESEDAHGHGHDGRRYTRVVIKVPGYNVPAIRMYIAL